MTALPRLTVCGSGNAGLAIAADCSLAGLAVSLYELPRLEKNIDPVRRHGGIEVTPDSEPSCGKTGFAALETATIDAAEAVKDTDVIMITVPAMYHTMFWDALAPHLTDGQIVVFNTGYFGCLQHAEKRNRLSAKVTLAESSIMPYLCERDGHHTRIIRYKRSFRIAAFPGKETRAVYDTLRKIYPQYEPVDTVLDTNIASSGNPAFHPTLILPVAGLYFDRYMGGKMYSDATSMAGRLIKAYDDERKKLSDLLGSPFFETTEAFETRTYEYTGKDIIEMLRKSNHIDWFAPAAYIRQVVEEDLLYAYIPMVLLAEQLGLSLPATRSMVEILGVMLGEDYWSRGVDPVQLGIAGMDRDTLLSYVMNGTV
jgi:opine dehydrogenase